MEQNLPAITKRVWNIVRTALYMLRKGISKGKLMAELNVMFKRWKIAGKALQNLMFHHSHHWSTATTGRRGSPLDSPIEYEFSCGNSPAGPNIQLPLHLNKRKHNHHRALFSPAAKEEDYATMNAVARTLEMLNSAAASPALPGFGKSPIVRQLRITDSPFPLRDADEDNQVDEAAEEFIKRFYNDLRRQNA
ncbi:uncharacterized protein LOC111387240 [Olea europaea var. sylvestris]|uniref:uncharacterized protein LOC111387240 n=1 Tax=Olea europaea var. sylvestris TaxID=158386 RepID=UPI000C1CE021|nr:uncharacterized protein LOC111387240 [Olea europaea var. sylvestris]